MTTAQRINAARDNIYKAQQQVVAINNSSMVAATAKKPKPRSEAQRKALDLEWHKAGHRYRLSKVILAQLQAINDLLYELPGVDWQKKSAR